MKSKKFYTYLSIFLVHVLLLLVAFLKFRIHPMEVLLSSKGDGIKNIFTLISYCSDKSTNGGMFLFHNMLYPFGDYVFYTDNTPFFSVPLRWFCLHVHDVSAYSVQIFYCFILSNFAAAGLLTYYIFSRLLQQNTFAYIMAITLPWINMQVPRIWHGHYNLSLTSVILIGIVLIVLWDKHKNSVKKQMLVGGLMCIFSVIAFFIHGYFLAIVTLFIASMLFFYGLFNIKTTAGKFSIAMSAIYPVVTGSIAIALLFSIDHYYKLRPVTANGYDWMEEKIRFSYLFGHYDFEDIFFPISTGLDTFEPEKAGYLGNIAVFGSFIILACLAVSKKFREYFLQLQKTFFSDPLKSGIILGGLVLLSVSMGETYITSKDLTEGYKITNILNPFLYLHVFTKAVEQFRSLERFIWPFFFAFYVWVMYAIVNFYKDAGKKLKIAILAATIFIGAAEIKDFVDESQAVTGEKNIFSAQNLKEVQPQHLDFKKYQAILPLPYYLVGVEDTGYLYCLDDYAPWTNFNYCLSLNSGLPLMASVMSRTPPEFARLLENFVAYDSLNSQLMSKMNNKPILISLNKDLLKRTDLINIPTKGANAQYYWNATKFVERHHLSPVDSLNGVYFYEWFPPMGAK